jgi:hypothetical protein
MSKFTSGAILSYLYDDKLTALYTNEFMKLATTKKWEEIIQHHNWSYSYRNFILKLPDSPPVMVAVSLECTTENHYAVQLLLCSDLDMRHHTTFQIKPTTPAVVSSEQAEGAAQGGGAAEGAAQAGSVDVGLVGDSSAFPTDGE